MALGGAGLRGPDHAGGVGGFSAGGLQAELTVLVKTPETAKPLEELAPFTEAYPIPETGVRYYLCRNGACARPGGQYFRSQTAAGTELRILPKGLRRTARFAA